jgi:hypothetical protein
MADYSGMQRRAHESFDDYANREKLWHFLNR